MKYLYHIVIMLLLTLSVYAQEDDFSADRPGLSDAPDLITPGNWQIEAGIDLSKYNHSGLWQLPTNTVRYGLSRYFECRLDFGGQLDPNSKIYGISQFAFGLKTFLISQKSWHPQGAFLIELYTPSFGPYRSSFGLGMELCLNHNLKNDDNLYYNFGINWIDLNQKPTFNGLLGYNHEINNDWDIFGEIYFYLSEAKPINYVTDAGITWLMTESFEWDFSFGLNLRKPSGNLYAEIGIAYSFGKD